VYFSAHFTLRAALYNPGNKPVFFKDVAAARELAESLRGFPRQKTLDRVLTGGVCLEASAPVL
jgi:hypothetical protein